MDTNDIVERQCAALLLDMPLNSMDIIRGHRVERFADGWSIDGRAGMSHRTAVQKVSWTADVSYSRKIAEQRLCVANGVMSVEQLAEKMSLQNTEETVSVYDATLPFVSISSVYLCGKNVS